MRRRWERERGQEGRRGEDTSSRVFFNLSTLFFAARALRAPAARSPPAASLHATHAHAHTSLPPPSLSPPPGFGIFERKERAARVGRNPKTGAELQIKAKKYPAFTAGKTFKDRVAVGEE